MALKNLEKLHDNLYLGVNVGSGVTGKGRKTKDGTVVHKGNGVWTVEIRLQGQRIQKTTKVKYEEGSTYSRQKALEKAYQIFQPYAERAANNLPVNNTYSIGYLSDKYLDDVDGMAEENEKRKAEGFSPRHRVYGGKSYWTKYSKKRTWDTWRLYITPWIRSLPDTKGMKGKLIQEWNKRLVDEFDDYIVRNFPHLSIETRLKTGVEINLFTSWLYDKRYINDVFKVSRTSRGGVVEQRKRMRKEISEKDYMRMVEWIKDRYTNKHLPLYNRQYNYIFYSWFILCANTGIRPPSGARDHTMIYWRDVKIDGEFEKTPLLARPDEKGHSYEAVIMGRAAKQLRRLREWYKELGLKCTPDCPVFAHPSDQFYSQDKKYEYETPDGRIRTIHRKSEKAGTYRWKKGDPIKNFKNAWDTMCEELGINPPVIKGYRHPQSERVSPASLRAWFITQRLYAKGRLDIEKLARVTGTSVQQIDIRYARLDAARSYDYLTAGGYDDGDAKEIYVDGMYIGTEDSLYIKSNKP
jgi:hypothetical protein